ncbi:YciI family protein [Mesorhizobium sp. WSM2239]|jgi:hypothetical protein|uniref:YciI family protein n=2 Tax=unclassified Mesorhizobium TaxID=325217 RepID=A0AAU8DAU3_9HYPH
MQYLLMLYVNEAGWPKLTPAQQEQGTAAYVAYTEALRKAGALVATNRLRPSASAATIRIAGDKPQVLDGPYAESREQIGGYYLIEAPDHDAAMAWAARCPTVDHGVVEVREIWPV